MNKTATVALASLLALSPLAGVAYAQDMQPTTTDTMPTGAISTEGVQVVYISSLDGDDSQGNTYSIMQAKANDPAALEQAQVELQSDPGLTSALTAQNVQLQNVVHIQTAGNGGKIVYVK